MSKKWHFWILIVLLIIVLVVGFRSLQNPRIDRNRIERDTIAAKVMTEWDRISINDMRNFVRRTEDDYDIRYYDKVFDISDVVWVDYFLSTFALKERLGHTFLSFELNDGSRIAVSVEARKEQWESYHPINWLLNQYELLYVIADEEDLITLRTQAWKEPVYRYPLAVTSLQAQSLLRSLLDTAHELSKKPKFYNTLTDNCTTVLRKHVNSIAPWTFGFHHSLLLTGLNDYYLLSKGYIDTISTKDTLRNDHRINEKVDTIVDEEEFSKLLRE